MGPAERRVAYFLRHGTARLIGTPYAGLAGPSASMESRPAIRSAAGCARSRQRRHSFINTTFGAPGGFIGGNGAGFGAGGASLSRIACQRLMRGDSGKRSAAIVSRSSPAMTALSSGERSLIPPNYATERQGWPSGDHLPPESLIANDRNT